MPLWVIQILGKGEHVKKLGWLLVLGLLLCRPAQGRALAPEEVPGPLVPWVDWVLQTHPDRDCPLHYDRALPVCRWPSRLSLVLDEAAGSFVQDGTLFAEGWLYLPGGEAVWPQDVSLDGDSASVALHQGRPALYVEPGVHRSEGAFVWRRMPESLPVPPDTALISLSLMSEAVPAPAIDPDGKLWLRDRGAGQGDGQPPAHLGTEAFRRLVDDNPFQVVTRLELDVAGPEREVTLRGALLDGLIPLSLDSPLPARLENDGQLRIQVRPGRWVVTLIGRALHEVTGLSAPPVGAAPSSEAEIWVFDARNDLRLVRVQGAPEVDPRQTRLPADWQRLPVYRLEPGQGLSFEVVRRGDADPEPDRLELERSLWLDFDGGGYTLRDQITGSLRRDWRLNVDPDIKLGRVRVDGAPQLITRLKESGAPGVEIRRGRVDLLADARIEVSGADLPAVGWDRDFHRVETRLSLPPGWSLFAASGPDRVSTGWLQRWSLLDLFLVLIIAMAVGRLWTWPWGLVALAGLALTWHQPGSPQWVWVNLLAAVALLRVLPAGRMRVLVSGYRRLVLVALVVIGVPFLIHQVRSALYPQLERLGASGLPMLGLAVLSVSPDLEAPVAVAPVQPGSTPPAAARRRGPEPAFSSLSEMKSRTPSEALSGSGGTGISTIGDSSLAALDVTDPDAVVQTGPGLPDWRWHSVSIGWSGPVQRGETLRLHLLSPAANLAIKLVGSVLVLLLAWRLWRPPGKPITPSIGVSASLVLGLMLLGPAGHAQAQDGYPPPELLRDLEQRLVEPPECLPACAQISRMGLVAGSSRLLLQLEVHTQGHVAVPLPVAARDWLPELITLDDEPATDLMRDAEGGLWLGLERGVHQVALAAELGSLEQVAIPLALPPRHLDAEVEGWTLLGLDPDGRTGGQLRLVREQPRREGTQLRALQPDAMPPFVRIERHLHLGLDWRVKTRVVRLAPASAPILLRFPLMVGESVTTDAVQVEADEVLISLTEGEKMLGWESSLERVSQIRLQAVSSPHWTLVWGLDLSPIWHVELEGIPVVHRDPSEGWLPEWRPWPGESVTLKISRPQGVAGRTLTVDQSRLTLRPGQRTAEVDLQLVLRASKGGQHSIGLPEGARLLSVAIDGRAQPIRQEGRALTLPLVPGAQSFAIKWREDRRVEALLRTSQVDLGTPSVNASIRLQPGRDRWVLLTGGPDLGPAVLFWGVLLVILVLAVGLGRSKLTPLGPLQWLLLGVGLSQSSIWMGGVVVAWLLTLGLRGRRETEISRGRFNWTQIGLALLSLLALWMLFAAVQRGLLGYPQMQVAGNGSSAYDLKWYQDRTGPLLPQAWVLSVPLYGYRIAMLAWALWLAMALIGWLRWGWGCYARGGLWRAIPWKLRKGYRKRRGGEQGQTS
jgi:hypothetical protein